MRFYLLGLFALVAVTALAQDNYEIQVYPGDTVEPRRTMVEFHSNFTAEGRKPVEDGVLPTHHAFHETLEITHGWNAWFETGYYIFSYDLFKRAAFGVEYYGGLGPIGNFDPLREQAQQIVPAIDFDFGPKWEF